MISCKEYVEIRKQKLKEQIATFKRKPKLCVIQIGNDPASCSYIKGKRNDALELGIEFEHVHISDYENFSQVELTKIINDMNEDHEVDGIIVQLPIPNEYSVEVIQRTISKWKDVDGFKTDSPFAPCTPKGIIDWLEYNNYDFEGKNVTVLGRSKIVGKPLVNMLIDRGATVTCCNSKTKDISQYTLKSDLIISAVGKAKLLSWQIPENAVVVDVGINRDENGKLCGDVTPGITFPGTYITPVPGGVGLLTRLALMENVIKYCR